MTYNGHDMDEFVPERTAVYIMKHAWSIKYRLIMKLITQLATNLRDESFKPN